jgi:hypothetical protein
MAQEKVKNGQILQTPPHLDSSKSLRKFLLPRCFFRLPSQAFSRKPSLTSSTLIDEVSNFEGSSSLSDCTTFQSMKDESQSLVTNSNSDLSTKNQPSGCLTNSRNTSDLLEKTRILHTHRSLYPSISDINSIFENHKARHTTYQQSSTDKNCDYLSPLRSKCLESPLIGLRRSTECLLDDNDDFFDDQCYHHFIGSHGHTRVQRNDFKNLDYGGDLYSRLLETVKAPSEIMQFSKPNELLHVTYPNIRNDAMEAYYNHEMSLFGTSLDFEIIENKLIPNKAINILEKEANTNRLPSSSRSKYLTDNDDDRWRPSPSRLGGDYLLCER